MAETMKYGWLRVLNPAAGSPDQYPLDNLPKQANVIGRKVAIAPSDVTIELVTSDLSISRRHCAIKVQFGSKGWTYLLSDLGSKTKTKLYKRNNPQKMIKLEEGEAVYLTEEDVIHLGEIKMQLVLPFSETIKP